MRETYAFALICAYFKKNTTQMFFLGFIKLIQACSSMPHKLVEVILGVVIIRLHNAAQNRFTRASLQADFERAQLFPHSLLSMSMLVLRSTLDLFLTSWRLTRTRCMFLKTLSLLCWSLNIGASFLRGILC